MGNTLNNFTRKSNLWVVENLTLDELKLNILNNYFLNGTVLVSNRNEVNSLIEFAIKKFKKIDILVNNAGISL